MTPATLWGQSWARLAAVYPDIENALAQLEHQRPTRFRALARLEGAAGRAAGRSIRGTASLSQLEERLQTWTSAVLAALAELDSPSLQKVSAPGRLAARSSACAPWSRSVRSSFLRKDAGPLGCGKFSGNALRDHMPDTSRAVS